MEFLAAGLERYGRPFQRAIDALAAGQFRGDVRSEAEAIHGPRSTASACLAAGRQFVRSLRAGFRGPGRISDGVDWGPIRVGTITSARIVGDGRRLEVDLRLDARNEATGPLERSLTENGLLHPWPRPGVLSRRTALGLLARTIARFQPARHGLTIRPRG